MKSHLIYIALSIFLISTFACTKRIVLNKNAPKKCYEILKQLNYRILPINDSVYTFRFLYPPVDTLNLEAIQYSKRYEEYKNFCYLMTNFHSDSFSLCDIKDLDIIEILGKPSNVTLREGKKGISIKGKVFNYLFGFGLECDPTKPYLQSFANCNGIRFYFDENGILYECNCKADSGGVEYIFEDFMKKRSEETQKKLLSELPEKEKILLRLASYIKRHNNNSYDFLCQKIDVPLNFDTITWTDNEGNKFRTSDALKTQYLIYHKKLDSLVSYSLQKENISLEDIVKFFSAPMDGEISKDGLSSSLFYYFNTPALSDCYNKEIQKSGKCSKLIFQFDENRVLIGVDSTFFWP
jgi:hypothetical protein